VLVGTLALRTFFDALLYKLRAVIPLQSAIISLCNAILFNLFRIVVRVYVCGKAGKGKTGHGCDYELTKLVTHVDYLLNVPGILLLVPPPAPGTERLFIPKKVVRKSIFYDRIDAVF